MFNLIFIYFIFLISCFLILLSIYIYANIVYYLTEKIFDYYFHINNFSTDFEVTIMSVVYMFCVLFPPSLFLLIPLYLIEKLNELLKIYIQ